MKYANPIIEIMYFGKETVSTDNNGVVTVSTYAADAMANSMFNGANHIIKVNSAKVYDIMNYTAPTN